MQQEAIEALKSNINRKFVGKEAVTENLIVALLAGGHVLIEDVPGVGKTTLAKVMAKSVDGSFSRIQLTPDTLPTDIIGTSVYSAKNDEFKVVKGPIFSNIFLADEINRTSPKTQSALLEAMEERQVTLDGTTYALPEPFLVLATQNPSEQIGTYPLPEAELDRFMMKLHIGYPAREEHIRLADRFLTGELEAETKPVVSVQKVVEMKQEVRTVICRQEVVEYCLSIIEKTRDLKEVLYGLSPRAGLELLRASQAYAYLKGRDYVIPEDVITMSKVCLPHRLILTTEAHITRYTGEQLISEVLDKVKRPV